MVKHAIFLDGNFFGTSEIFVHDRMMMSCLLNVAPKQKK